MEILIEPRQPKDMPPLSPVEAANVIIFSDVDGTLLDRDGRIPSEWPAIRRALRKCMFVLTSSRTVEELLQMQARLDVQGPLVAENGAVVVLTDDLIDPGAGNLLSLDGRVLRQIRIGRPVAEIVPIIRGAGLASGVSIQVSDGVATTTLSADTTLPLTSDLPSLLRTHSALLRVTGSDQQVSAFRGALAAAGVTASNSGRWLVVQSGSDKGAGARRLQEIVARRTGGSWTSVGVGDAENDRTLLRATDMRFVMRGPRGEIDRALADLPDTIAPTTPGIEGWREIVNVITRDTDSEAAP
jgi:predicted mannosyl-3-phosphoglycerate phosphatase (HAD superfamily)